MIVTVGSVAHAAASWPEIVLNLIGSGDIIGNLAKGIHEAINERNQIYDESRLRAMHARLGCTLASMNTLNSQKHRNLDSLKDYLSGAQPKPRWTEIQIQWKDIGGQLSKLLTAIDTDNIAIITAAGFTNSSALHAALDRQQDIYNRLADTPEPKSRVELDNARKTERSLEELYGRVQDLEGAIDEYLRKHAASGAVFGSNACS
jgi:RNAse (barnase) inhibitor barstar